QVLLGADLDLGAPVLRVQHDVAFVDVQRNAVAVVVNATRSNGHNGAFLRLLLGGVRDHQAGGGGGFGFDLLDDNAVFVWLDRDWHSLSFSFMNQWKKR